MTTTEKLVEVIEEIASPSETVATVQEAVAVADVLRIEAQSDADVQRINAQARAEERVIEARMGSPELQERISTCENGLAEIKSLLLDQTEILATLTNRLLAVETPTPAMVIVSTPPSSSPISSEPPETEAPLVNPADADGHPVAETESAPSNPALLKKKRNYL